MTNNANKEKWIDDVLGSARQMQKGEPGADLFEKITAGLAKPYTVKVTSLPGRQWAAAAVLLLTVNIGSVVYFTTHNKKAVVTSNPFAAAMQSETTYNY